MGPPCIITRMQYGFLMKISCYLLYAINSITIDQQHANKIKYYPVKTKIKSRKLLYNALSRHNLMSDLQNATAMYGVG